MDAKKVLIGGGIIVLGVLAYETAKADEYYEPSEVGATVPFQAIVCDTEVEVKTIAKAAHESWEEGSNAFFTFHAAPNEKHEATCENEATPPIKILSKERLDTIIGQGQKVYMAWAVKATFPDGSDYWMMVAMKEKAPVEGEVKI